MPAFAAGTGFNEVEMGKKIGQYFRNYFQHQQALHYRDYRLFMTGQTLSLIGTWIQRMAMIWLAYQLTGSAFLLGVVGFCEQIPIFVLAPFAGVYADRWDKHKALLRIETLALVQALVLGVLTLTGLVHIWHIIALSLFLGIINAFEVPIRQSFVVEMVDRDKKALSNAIALNSTLFNLSRLIGPSIAGILISLAGEGWCFMVNAASYGGVLASLLLMHTRTAAPPRVAGESIWGKMKEGIRYVGSQPFMKNLLIMLAVVSFSNAALRTLAPVFAQKILKGDASTLGFLMTAAGVGAIIGALFLTGRQTTQRLKRIVSYTGLLLGIALTGFAFSNILVVSMVLVAIAGLAQMTHTASTNTLLQLSTDDDKRGRVMSFYTMCLQGTMPFGSLVVGSLADFTTGPWAMASMGIFCLLGTLLVRNKATSKQSATTTLPEPKESGIAG